MSLFKKKKEKTTTTSKKVEYERDYDEELENDGDIREENVESNEDNPLYNSDIQQLVNLDIAEVPDGVFELLRNSYYLESDDTSMDEVIFHLTRKQMIERLLEMQGIYGKTDFIKGVIEDVCGIDLNLDSDIPYINEIKEKSPTDKKEQDSEANTEHYTDNRDENEADIELIMDKEPAETMENHFAEESGKMGVEEVNENAVSSGYDENDVNEAENSESDDEEVDILLEIIDYNGISKLYVMSELTESEDLEILDMLSEINYDRHITDIPAYLESCGAVLSDGSGYSREEIYVTYNVQDNTVI